MLTSSPETLTPPVDPELPAHGEGLTGDTGRRGPEPAVVGWLIAGMFLAIAAMTLAVVGKIDRPLEETGPLEILQASIVAAAVLGVVLWVMRAAEGARAWPVFLGVAAMLVFAREADFAMVLNPKHFGEYGVRYRIDWWLNFGVPLWLKAAWAGFFALVGAAIAVPAALGWRQADRERRAGDPTIKLLLMSAGMYLVGYAMDDLLGRGQFVPTWASMTVEEGAELCGAILLLATCVPGMRKWVAPRFAR